jgi:hypothetical protein
MKISDYFGRVKSAKARKRGVVGLTLFTLATSMLVSPAKSQAQELLTNPGFETTGGWSVNNWSGSTATVTTQSTTVHSGTKAQQVNVTALPTGSGYIYKQNYTLTAGNVYEASIWLRPSTSAVKVQFFLRRAGAFYDAVAARTITLDPAINPNWQKFTVRGGSLTGEPFFCGINFLTTGEIYIDDASLTDVTTTVHANGAPATSEAIPKSYFGIHINKGHNGIWPALNHGLVRLWDTGTMWKNIEPTDDAWNWTRFDLYVNSLIRGNDTSTKILYTLGQTPAWAASNPTVSSAYGAGASSGPADIDEWREYVRAVATRYAGKIHYYEIWNETNVTGSSAFYTGGVTKMVEMANTARQEILAADPNAIIVAPNITSNGIGFLESFIAEGGDAYVDAYSTHIYTSLTPEESLVLLTNVRQLLASYGINKPVLDTEGRAAGSATPSASESRASVARNYLLKWAFGATNFSWYAWDINSTGHVNLSVSESGSTLADGGIAYAAIAQWLTGAQMTYRGVDANGLWTIGIKRGQNYTGTIVWKRSGTVTYTIPPAIGAVRRRNLDGTSTSLIGSTTTVVTTEPILLENSTTPLFSAKVNFQPSTATVPSGFLSDSGAAFGNRGNYWNYGWNTTNSTAVDCDLTTPQEFDTLIVSQGKTWNLDVPAGLYTVRLVAGDARYYNETFKVDVEGVQVINGTTSSIGGTHFIDNTVTGINCTDGKLTVTDGAGSTNNKLCFVEVVQTQQL